MSKKFLKRAALFLVKIVFALVFIAPFYIAIVYAFKSPQETLRSGLTPPTSIHLPNFTEAIKISNFALAAKNSTIVTVCSALIIMIVCSMAAYVLARNARSKFYNSLYYLFLAAILLPFQVVMLPVYVTMKNLDLMNSLTGLILTTSGFQIAYNVFIFTGFIKSIPLEMEEAAFIDGAGKLYTFWKIIFPLMKPITSSALVLSVLSVWNEFQIALIIAQKPEVRTIPLTQFFFFGQYSIQLNLAFAAFVLAMIPIIALYLLMQKYIVGGIMSGAVKG